MTRLLCVLPLLLIGLSLNAQVEIYRGEDTSTYIAPSDTITKPPVYGLSDRDFFQYIELHVSMLNIGNSLTYAGGSYKFSFYVEKDGKLSDFTMITFTDANVANELKRVISGMPSWNPGYYQGKKKRTMMIYNVNVRSVNDIGAIEVTMNDYDVEYTRATNPLKWSMVIGSVLLLIGFIIVRS